MKSTIKYIWIYFSSQWCINQSLFSGIYFGLGFCGLALLRLPSSFFLWFPNCALCWVSNELVQIGLQQSSVLIIACGSKLWNSCALCIMCHDLRASLPWSWCLWCTCSVTLTGADAITSWKCWISSHLQHFFPLFYHFSSFICYILIVWFAFNSWMCFSFADNSAS